MRRKFVDAEADYPVCAKAIELIANLYQVDKETIDPTLLDGEMKLLAAKNRLAARSTQSPNILEELKAWALEQRGLPRSSLRKAIDYMLGHWEPLKVFMTDPFVPLDNNATERALRGIVLGRKNHYGSRSERGTQVAAICYSLIESAKMAGLEVQAYLTAAVYGLEQGVAPERLLPLRELWQDKARSDGASTRFAPWLMLGRVVTLQRLGIYRDDLEDVAHDVFVMAYRRRRK